LEPQCAGKEVFFAGFYIPSENMNIYENIREFLTAQVCLQRGVFI